MDFQEWIKKGFLRVGKLLIFSYFTDLSVTESIIKYLAKKTRRKKMDCAFEVYFLFLFAVKVAERYSPDKLESLPILFRYLRDQRDFKAKRKKMKRLLKISQQHQNRRYCFQERVAPEAILCCVKIKNSLQLKIQFSGN